ncbi:hypothetical protein HDU98_005285, partial [Podochytrium sp. JEL0797]
MTMRRWIAFILSFNIKFIAVPTDKNIADPFTRMYGLEDKPSDFYDGEELEEAIDKMLDFRVVMCMLGASAYLLKEDYGEDEEIALIAGFLDSLGFPDVVDVKRHLQIQRKAA